MPARTYYLPLPCPVFPSHWPLQCCSLLSNPSLPSSPACPPYSRPSPPHPSLHQVMWPLIEARCGAVVHGIGWMALWWYGCGSCCCWICCGLRLSFVVRRSMVEVVVLVRVRIRSRAIRDVARRWQSGRYLAVKLPRTSVGCWCSGRAFAYIGSD